MYDKATHQAIVLCCADNGISLSDEDNNRCPQNVCDEVMKLSVPEATTTTTTEPTTSTTQPTEPVVENYVVRIKEKAKLYRQANTKEALYWLDAGSQYTYIEEMEADGQLWYRVRYSANTTGWIFADRAEKIPAPQE